MSSRTVTEYAFDYGDELDDFQIEGGMDNDSEARFRSHALGKMATSEPDLYKHKLVKRTLTVTEGEWVEVIAHD